jgi:hypothetical protein
MVFALAVEGVCGLLSSREPNIAPDGVLYVSQVVIENPKRLRLELLDGVVEVPQEKRSSSNIDSQGSISWFLRLE